MCIRDRVEILTIGSLNFTKQYRIAPAEKSRISGFAPDTELMTSDNSGSGSKTKSGSESSAAALPAMMCPDVSDSSMWP